MAGSVDPRIEALCYANGISWQKTEPVDFGKAINTSTLKGQSAIVTGGASGIGAGAVAALAEAGAYVTSADLSGDGQKLVDELKARGLHAQFIKTDVLSWSSLVSMFRAAIDFAPHHSLDIVVTSAGLRSNSIVPWLKNTPIDASDSELKPFSGNVLEVNLLGTWYCTQLALHFFRSPAADTAEAPKVQSKQLVFLASAAGYGDQHSQCDYNTSKFGVRGLWHSLRKCTGILGHGTIAGAPMFQTNLIAPWFVRTNMVASSEPAFKQYGLRPAEIPDAVDAILRCVTDESIYARSIMVAPGGKEGNNFDVYDDMEHGAGVQEILKRVKSGLLQWDLLETLQGKPEHMPKWTDS
ncbi:MAG: hypothetical protein M1821_001914 [Bathelium mastoideum]|nr:MAG: hypothetical protein M1821_001914 [Bathelium mastoideum]